MLSCVLEAEFYGRGLGSQCYLTFLHASCNVATFNVWLFNAWYSCFNSNLTLLHSISSFRNLASVHLTFVLRPCRIFIVQCVMQFFVLPLFILRPVIILTSSFHHCFVYANLWKPDTAIVALSRYRVIALSRYRLVNGSRKFEHFWMNLSIDHRKHINWQLKP